MLQNWKTMKIIFGLLLTSMILFKCGIWGSNTLDQKLRKVEIIKNIKYDSEKYDTMI